MELNIKRGSYVTLWNGKTGTVLEVVADKAHIALDTGRKHFAALSEITAAIDTYAEKDAKFLAAKDKLSARRSQSNMLPFHGVSPSAQVKKPESKKEPEPVKTSAFKAYAPGHVDEAEWKRAEEAIAKSSGKPKSEFGDKEWATVNTVYQNMVGTFKKKESAKTAGHANDFDTKYSIGDMLVTEGVAPEHQLLFVKNIDTKKKVYVLERRPLGDLDIAKTEPTSTYGVRYEEPIATVDKDKKLSKFSSIDHRRPSELLAVRKRGSLVELQFNGIQALYSTSGRFIRARKTAGQYEEGEFYMGDVGEQVVIFDSKKRPAIVEIKEKYDSEGSALEPGNYLVKVIDPKDSEYPHGHEMPIDGAEISGQWKSDSKNTASWSRAYQAEFGAIVKQNGYERLAAVVAQKRIARKIQAAEQYKSDADIANEFSGMKITDISVKTQNWQDSDYISGWLTLEFPEAGEHVSGGQEGFSEVSDSWMFYNFGEWKAGLDAEGDSSVIPKMAFDSWYPGAQGTELKEGILAFLLKEMGVAKTAALKTARLRPENKKMQDFLRQNGIDCSVKYVSTGSMRGAWILQNPVMKWTPELVAKLNELGFKDFHGGALSDNSGNGGMFSVYVRGHEEFLKAEPQDALQPEQAMTAAKTANSKSIQEQLDAASYAGDIVRLQLVGSPTYYTGVPEKDEDAPGMYVLYRDNESKVNEEPPVSPMFALDSVEKIEDKFVDPASGAPEDLERISARLTRKMAFTELTPGMTVEGEVEATTKRLAKKAARLGNYDFDIHGGANWKLEACDDSLKIKRVKR